MRHIEFRARHKESGEVCAVLSIDFVNREVDVLPESELEGGNQVAWSFDEIDLEQATGILDKHGTMIYEWDLIEFLDDIPKKRTETVRWEDNAWFPFYDLYYLDGEMGLGIKYETIEIIKP